MNCNNVSKVPFEARLVSRANIKLPSNTTHYDIYELGEEDASFLIKMQNAVDLKRLYKVPLDKLRNWNALFECATTMGSSFGLKNFLIANEMGRPCGALVTKKYNPNQYKVWCLCTWPAEVGKRAVLAGKSLMLGVYKKILNEDGSFSGMSIEAVRDGLFNPVKRYLDLGFSHIGGDEYNANMSISRDKMAKILDKYDDIVHIEEINSVRRVNLDSVLDISY